MPSETVLMAFPEHLRAEAAARTVYRVGALIFRHGQSGIVGHVTEAGGLEQAAMALASAPLAASPVGLGLKVAGTAAKLGMQAYTVHQNSRILDEVATLRSLQFGGLVLSGVGIGVSIAGFALLARRIDAVREQVAALSESMERIERKLDGFSHRSIDAEFAQLSTACEQVKEAWASGDSQVQWRGAARDLHGLQNLFAARVRRLLAERRPAEALPFAAAYAVAGSTRVTSRLAAGDDDAARGASAAFGRELAGLTAPVGAADLLRAVLSDAALTPSAEGYLPEAERRRPEALAQALLLREQEALAASQPLTLAALADAGIGGRVWLERARAESDSALLFLKSPSERT